MNEGDVHVYHDCVPCLWRSRTYVLRDYPAPWQVRVAAMLAHVEYRWHAMTDFQHKGFR